MPPWDGGWFHPLLTTDKSSQWGVQPRPQPCRDAGGRPLGREGRWAVLAVVAVRLCPEKPLNAPQQPSFQSKLRHATEAFQMAPAAWPRAGNPSVQHPEEGGPRSDRCSWLGRAEV